MFKPVVPEVIVTESRRSYPASWESASRTPLAEMINGPKRVSFGAPIQVRVEPRTHNSPITVSRSDVCNEGSSSLESSAYDGLGIDFTDDILKSV